MPSFFANFLLLFFSFNFFIFKNLHLILDILNLIRMTRVSALMVLQMYKHFLCYHQPRRLLPTYEVGVFTRLQPCRGGPCVRPYVFQMYDHFL